MKRILFVLSEWGNWGEELIGPLEACDAAGYEITFITPTGKKPTPLGASTNPGFIDPPLGRSVTSSEMAEKTRNVHNSNRLDEPRNLILMEVWKEACGATVGEGSRFALSRLTPVNGAFKNRRAGEAQR